MPSCDTLRQEIERLQRQYSLRELVVSDPAHGTTQIEREGKSLSLFCANDYLGLSRHPAVLDAVLLALQKFGIGAGASRLLSGNSSLYARLESDLARLKATESALVFSTGYMANLGALGALIAPDDLILADRLSHASLIEGARHAKGRFRLYPHQAMDQLKKELEKRKPTQKAFILTEGIFSMEGEIAPLPALLTLAEQYDATIYLDDAHATGVLGPKGEGTCAHFGLRSPRILQMGTLSKAIGGLGGFLAADDTTVQYLVNKARTLIYTTALPPALLAAAIAALAVIRSDDGPRQRLWHNTTYFLTQVRQLGFDVGATQTPIVPIFVGDSETTLRFSRKLLEAGFYVPAIRPPTVPLGTSRLRISLMADHTQSEMDRLLSTLQAVGRTLRLI